MLRVTFSNNFWSRFGETIRKTLFFETSFRYDFGIGSRDVREVCRWHLVSENRDYLRSQILIPNKLIGLDDFSTVKKIMKYVNTTYPSSVYYLKDGKRETWNTPVQTINSFEDRKLGLVPKHSTDCDDYAILIINLCRAADVDKNSLFLNFMKTTGEWHLNVMFYHDFVPYAVEGTYNPDYAMKVFGKIPYFNIDYYQYVKWSWNEDKVYRYNDKINPLNK